MRERIISMCDGALRTISGRGSDFRWARWLLHWHWDGRESEGSMSMASDNMIEMRVDVQEILREGAERTDRALERLVPPVTETPASIHGAMRHSVFAGGKRLRPMLAMEAARTINAGHGGSGLPEGIEDLGAAIEM